jgi:D-sedoheptulose 7-phosphate isomerase
MTVPATHRKPPATRRGVRETIQVSLRDAAQLHAQLPKEQVTRIAKAAALMAKAIAGGRKVIWFGNGGSATQSQHMAGEFVGRFQRERRSLPSISLTENMASVTAIANDYAFDQIFSRQLEGLAQPGDVAVGLSTSGNSRNVLEGLRKARTLGLITIGLTGGSGGPMAQGCDICIGVPSTITARIQEVHLTIGHILCGLVEDALACEA